MEDLLIAPIPTASGVPRDCLPRTSRWRVAVGLALLLALGPAPMSASAAVRGSGSTSTPDTTARTGDFSLNLYRPGDFVSQYTPYWCVGASMQMMLAISDVDETRSRAAQETYMRVARSEGPARRQVDHGAEDAGGLRGAGSEGWARGLVELGAGRYEQRVFGSYMSAVRAVAYALRKTSRPVGLIVWRGAHAWVVSGITTTDDPLVDPEFRVTGVYVQDPWYPRVSSIWGRGKEPNTYLSLKALRSAFLPRRGGRWHPGLAGKFVVVLPVDTVWRAPQLRRLA